MKKYIKYLKYIIRHKWYVFIECAKEGYFVRGILHDMSKFLPSEFIPYANYFYGNKSDENVKQNNGYYKPKNTGNSAFEMAWFLHQKRNKHHWQWWIIKKESGDTDFDVMPMDTKYAIEMICDWVGAGKAQGRKSPKNDPYKETREWYSKNNHKMMIHPYTKLYVETVIGYNVKKISKDGD
jgi:hypothetical protein